MNYLKKRKSALGHAFAGVVQSFKRETHLQLHFMAALLAAGAGLYLNINRMDWFMILSAITLVITLEMLNSAIEKLCDRLVPEIDPTIKYIKDVSAAAVLVACVFALTVGLMVFLPYFKQCSSPL